ncbi:MAG: hypothetical protein FWE58_00955 [Methanobrevibacter sp.]|nr:hypothetical protein [Methanobrevibacter sp.]
MKIITWNLDFWKSGRNHTEEQYNFLFDEFEADIVLLQEMPDPKFIPTPFQHILYKKCKQNWGTGILSKLPLTQIETNTDYAVAGSVNVNNQTLDIVSIYGSYYNNSLTQNKYVTMMHEIISKISPIILSKNYRNVLIGGDWNLDRTLDGKSNTKNANQLVFDRLEDMKLTDLISKFIRQPIVTHRHNRGGLFWLDYLYAGANFDKWVKNVKIIENKLIIEISDHNPIILEINLPNS